MGALLHNALATACPAREAQAAAGDRTVSCGRLKHYRGPDGSTTCLLPFGDGHALVGYEAWGPVVTIQGAWLGPDQEIYADSGDFSAGVIAGWQKAIGDERQRDADDFDASRLEGGPL